MAFERSCPGSKTIKDPRPEYIPCKNCGKELEMWSDETKVTCPKCQTVHFKEQNLACIAWCSFAKDCVGEETYNRLIGDRKMDSGAERDRQIEEARAKLRALVEGKSCKIGGEIIEA